MCACQKCASHQLNNSTPVLRAVDASTLCVARQVRLLQHGGRGRGQCRKGTRVDALRGAP
eukprot:1984911-Prymnesium_polylepis.1